IAQSVLHLPWSPKTSATLHKARVGEFDFNLIKSRKREEIERCRREAQAREGHIAQVFQDMFQRCVTPLLLSLPLLLLLLLRRSVPTEYSGIPEPVKLPLHRRWRLL